MTTVAAIHDVDAALAYLRPALALLDKTQHSVAAANLDHVIQLLEEPSAVTPRD